MEADALHMELEVSAAAFACDASAKVAMLDAFFDVDLVKFGELERSTTPYAMTTFGPTALADIDALGFHADQAVLVGWDNTAEEVVQVDREGIPISLGLPANLPRVEYGAGDLDGAGTYYLVPRGFTDTLYRIDMSAVDLAAEAVLLDAPRTVRDVVYRPKDGRLYYVEGGALGWIDPEEGTTKELSLSGDQLDAAVGMWSDAFGRLYAYQAAHVGQGAIYAIDPDTLQATYVSEARRVADGDAASCAYRLGFRLEASSIVQAGTTTTVAYVFANARSEDLTIDLSDELPQGWTIEEINIVSGDATGVAATGSTHLELTGLMLPADAVTRVEVQARLLREHAPGEVTLSAELDGVPLLWGGPTIRSDGREAALGDATRVTVTEGVNGAPVADDDAITLAASSVPVDLTALLLAGDDDPDGDAITITNVDGTSSVGSVSHDSRKGTVAYATGGSSDIFQYTICDTFTFPACAAPATVRVTLLEIELTAPAPSARVSAAPVLRGSTLAGKNVTVSVGEHTAKTAADAEGNFRFDLGPFALAEAQHTLRVSAMDDVGQQSVQELRFALDRTAPETAVGVVSPYPQLFSEVTFSLEASEDASFECSLDGSPFTSCGASHSLAELKAGEHELAVRAVDLAGNVDATPQVYRWVINTDADGDGITNANEDLNHNGDPTDDDSDRDGYPNYLDLDDDADAVATADELQDDDADGMGNWLESKYTDSDGDGDADQLDADDDGDGLLTVDECKVSPCTDGDGDGIADHLDASSGQAGDGDSDGDGLPDSLECAFGTPCPDADRDQVPDYADKDSDNDGQTDHQECLEPASCPDIDGDGIPDVLESAKLDTDGDRRPDEYDSDDDGDGLPTFYECFAARNCRDYDGDGIPDNLDRDAYRKDSGDSDFDDIPDAVECPPFAPCPDSDQDRIPNYTDLNSDSDNMYDWDECTQSPCEDRDGDGLPDVAEPRTYDSDGDGDVDESDEDDDNDGVSTREECQGRIFCADADGDGIPKHLDAEDNGPTAGDSDGDGLSDSDECPFGYPCPDFDRSGFPDYLERSGEPDAEGPDEASEGLLSAFDDLSGEEDSDGDGVPDYVECPDIEQCPDSDEDGTEDRADVDDDGDGIATLDEVIDGQVYGHDTDEDGTPNYLDTDSDADGVPDAVEGRADNNQDEAPDYVDGRTPDAISQRGGCSVGSSGAAPLMVWLLMVWLLIIGALGRRRRRCHNHH